MTIINSLASVQGQKGSEANIALAKKIAISEDASAVKELIDNLDNKNKNIQSDCIKALYELGYIKPELIADYYFDFLKLLTNKNNRLVWGSMAALATIADLRHKEIYAELNVLIETVAKGSVITIDCGVEIMAKLNKYPDYSSKVEPLLLDQLWKCPIKQLPMYIEKSLISIGKTNKEIFQSLIENRKPECEKSSQVKRLEKSQKQIDKL